MKQSLLQSLINIRADLIKAAKRGRTVPYNQLMKKYGIPRGAPNGLGIGWVVGYVSDYEYKHNRPLLSAIVVHANKRTVACPKGNPGVGFLMIDGIPAILQRTAKDTGPLTKAEKKYIWKTQNSVWKFWKTRNLPNRPLNDFLNR